MGHIVKAVLDWGLVIRKSALPPRAIGELKKHYERPNPAFYKAEAMGFWTGNIARSVKAWDDDGDFLTLPRTAAGTVREVLDGLGLGLEVADDTVDGGPVNFKLQGELRDYQAEAVKEVVAAGSGIVRGPCGSGKTICLLGAIAAFRKRAIVVVHNTPLLDQWRGSISDWLGYSPGVIGAGKKKDLDKPIVVAMQRTLANVAKLGKRPSWADGFSVLAGDEVHHWAASTFQAVGRMFRARHFIGMSADHRRKDGLEFLIEWTFGPLLYEIKRESLESGGDLVPRRVYVVPTGYADPRYLESVCADESPDWPNMLNRMMDVRLSPALERARLVWKVVGRIVKDHPGARVLVLNERVEACRMLVEQFGMMGLSAGLMIGQPENRAELGRTKGGLQSGLVQVGVGTTVADEGLDIPALTHVVMTSPVHQHLKRFEQMIGRAARPWKGKRRAIAVYMWDRLMWPAVPEGDVKRGRLEQKVLAKLRGVVDDLRMMDGEIDFAGDDAD
jgi:superfamily II DNA or RNA helicase